MSYLIDRLKYLLRRWIPLLYLLPLAYMLRPILWTPIDYRFYNYFHAKRQVPPWTEVVVVGIDEKTTEEIWTAPVYPFSQHIESHAVVTKRLDEAGARAIVFDLAFTPELIGAEPVALAEAFRSSGMVYLTMTVREEWQTTNGGEELIGLRGVTPHELLVGAARGVYVADVTIDPDGYLRRFSADPRLAELGLETLPEHLAGVRVHRDVPIEFPSVENPVPLVSYRDILAGDTRALEQCAGRIVFVGSIIDQTDFITVPRLQILPQGHKSFRLPGVAALAAITESLIKGRRLNDSNIITYTLWNLLWCLIALICMPKKYPVKAAIVSILVILLSIIVTGLVQVFVGYIFPIGLLFGCLVISGGHTLVSSHVSTIKELVEEEAENKRIHNEMEMARKTQERLLPKELPSIEGLDIWGTNISSLEVSGDYYDLIYIQEEGSLVVAIADVSGKGIPASLLMANVQAGLHSNLSQERFNLHNTIINLNTLLCHNSEDHAFVTFFLAELKYDTLQLRYINAGHPPPFVLSVDGTVQKCEVAGMILGAMEDATYKVGEIQLNQGDIFCAFTDGVTEAQYGDDDEFGEDRIIEVVKHNRGKSAEEIGRALIECVKDYTHQSKQKDDITLVTVRVVPSKVIY